MSDKFKIQPAYNYVYARAMTGDDVRSEGGIIIPSETMAMFPNEYIILAIGAFRTADGKFTEMPWSVGDRIVAFNGADITDPNTGKRGYIFNVNTIVSFVTSPDDVEKFPTPKPSKSENN